MSELKKAVVFQPVPVGTGGKTPNATRANTEQKRAQAAVLFGDGKATFLGAVGRENAEAFFSSGWTLPNGAVASVAKPEAILCPFCGDQHGLPDKQAPQGRPERLADTLVFEREGKWIFVSRTCLDKYVLGSYSAKIRGIASLTAAQAKKA